MDSRASLTYKGILVALSIQRILVGAEIAQSIAIAEGGDYADFHFQENSVRFLSS